MARTPLGTMASKYGHGTGAIRNFGDVPVEHWKSKKEREVSGAGGAAKRRRY